MFIITALSVKAEVFPPPTALSANSVQSALTALGAAPLEPSTHLLLDVPDIALSGPVEVTATSMVPGTSRMILLRQWPVAPDSKPATAQRPAAGQSRAAAVPPANPPPPIPTVWIASKEVAPLDAATLTARVDFSRRENYYLLVQAQGKWYGAAREVKLATKPASP